MVLNELKSVVRCCHQRYMSWLKMQLSHDQILPKAQNMEFYYHLLWQHLVKEIERLQAMTFWKMPGDTIYSAHLDGDAKKHIMKKQVQEWSPQDPHILGSQLIS